MGERVGLREMIEAVETARTFYTGARADYMDVARKLGGAAIILCRLDPDDPENRRRVMIAALCCDDAKEQCARHCPACEDQARLVLTDIAGADNGE